MKKIIALAAASTVALLMLAGAAQAFQLAFTAADDGCAITWDPGMLPQKTVELAEPENVQRLISMPGLAVDLSLVSLNTDGAPKLTLRYVITSGMIKPKERTGTISLPYGHGFITDNPLYGNPDQSIHYDVQGSFIILGPRCGYSMQFGLDDLESSWQAYTRLLYPEIHQTITRDSSGATFAEIDLVFHPRLFYKLVDFSVVMTPDSATLPDDVFTFNGTVPMPEGLYHFWFYRDSKQN